MYKKNGIIFWLKRCNWLEINVLSDIMLIKVFYSQLQNQEIKREKARVEYEIYYEKMLILFSIRPDPS